MLQGFCFEIAAPRLIGSLKDGIDQFDGGSVAADLRAGFGGGLQLIVGVVALRLQLGQPGIDPGDLLVRQAAELHQIGQRVERPIDGIRPVLRKRAIALDGFAALVGAHGRRGGVVDLGAGRLFRLFVKCWG